MKPYGIPTKYGFINFRSRLEARWAAFFDLCGWSWTYEPFDLPGWIPDFEIAGPAGSMLVEIKPIRHYREFEALAKEIAKSMRDFDFVLLLGVSPLWDQSSGFSDCVVLGSSASFCLLDGGAGHGDLQSLMSGSPDFPYDICDNLWSYTGKLTGEYSGTPTTPARSHIERLWAEACNLTQWHAVTPR